MASAARKLATYDDVLRAPEHCVAELVDGELHVQPRPASRRAVAASNLGAELLPPFGRGRVGPGGWVMLFEPELHLGAQPHVLVPDLAGWRWLLAARTPRIARSRSRQTRSFAARPLRRPARRRPQLATADIDSLVACASL